MLEKIQKTAAPASSAVLPSLRTTMEVSLVLSPESDVWLLHGKPLPGILKWVEYDADLRNLILVMIDGRVQGTGFPVPDDMRAYMMKAEEIYVIQVDTEGIKDMYIVPLASRRVKMN